MSEEKKASTVKATRPEPGPLAAGAESSDPAVHQLLAERDIAARNGDTDAAEAATAQLAELGYR